MERTATQKKADILAAKLWSVLGRDQEIRDNRHCSVENFVDWECFAKAVPDPKFLDYKIRSDMAKEMCEKVSKVLRIATHESPIGKTYTMHGWFFDHDDIINLLYEAYMEGFNDAARTPISHTEIIKLQKLNTTTEPTDE